MGCALRPGAHVDGEFDDVGLSRFASRAGCVPLGEGIEVAVEILFLACAALDGAVGGGGEPLRLQEDDRIRLAPWCSVSAAWIRRKISANLVSLTRRLTSCTTTNRSTPAEEGVTANTAPSGHQYLMAARHGGLDAVGVVVRPTEDHQVVAAADDEQLAATDEPAITDDSAGPARAGTGSAIASAYRHPNMAAS